MTYAMIPAAKERMLSMNSDVCAVLPLAADPQLAENSRPGFATYETGSHRSFAVCNSTTALGIDASLVLEGIRKYESARYYDPTIGRFLSEDSIGLVGGANVYGYTENNPINFTDPEGLKATASLFGDTIYVDASVTIYGPRANAALASTWQTMIKNSWNRNGNYFKYGRCKVIFRKSSIALTT